VPEVVFEILKYFFLSTCDLTNYFFVFLFLKTKNFNHENFIVKNVLISLVDKSLNTTFKEKK
jgi:hypothetical protein